MKPSRRGLRRYTSRSAPAALAAAIVLAGCAHPGPREPDRVDPAAAPQVSEDDTIRLLEQSTFGPTPALVERVRRQGYDRYLDEQFRLATSQMPVLAPVANEANKVCPIGDDGKLCRRDNYSQFPLQSRFFQNALTEPDQLRQRMAFALGQIFVVSARKNNRAYAMARYQQLLLDDAFVNFRQLLGDVTLSPMMGQYLDMANNQKADAKRGVAPNENFAREVLQLFSVGLVQLNPDGSPRRAADGAPIPTYGPDEIQAFARAFTGWTYPPQPTAAPKPRNPAYFDGRLVPAPSAHDPGPKRLLNGQQIPGSPDPRQDLNAALDNIFQHPNVGPFIARRLIQHFTTSNPSPQYVARVAQVFDDNGHGVRGDLAAVLRAILLDPVARGDEKPDPTYGKLREPVLYITGVLRALGARSDGIDLIGQSATMEENVFVAPSVFNFFPPSYAVTAEAGDGSAAAVNAPELAIIDSNTSLKRAEFANLLFFGRPIAPDPTVPGAVGTTLALDGWQPLAARPTVLVDRLDTLLLHDSLPAEARDAVVQAVLHVPATDPATRVKTAAYLMVAGPQYQVER